MNRNWGKSRPLNLKEPEIWRSRSENREISVKTGRLINWLAKMTKNQVKVFFSCFSNTKTDIIFTACFFHIWSWIVSSEQTNEIPYWLWIYTELAQDNRLSKPKMTLYKEILSLQLVYLFIVRFLCLIVRPWDWTRNRESHGKIVRLERSVRVCTCYDTYERIWSEMDWNICFLRSNPRLVLGMNAEIYLWVQVDRYILRKRVFGTKIFEIPGRYLAEKYMLIYAN